METGIEYRLKLDIEGRHIITYVNGIKMNDIEDKIQINEELYFTAGIDEGNGDVIVKAVNVNETIVNAAVQSPFSSRVQADIEELSGHSRDDVNSFEEPEKVYPKSGTVYGEHGIIEYEFPPLSVTIFRIRENA